jgi:glycosyltransferase involved in cell wall biosynthesis
MRILYLNPCGQMGGAETSLQELLAGIRNAEPEWDLWLVLGEDGPLAQRARGLGVQVMVAPFPRGLARLGDAGQGPVLLLWSLLKAAAGTALYRRRLGTICRMIQPDIIHTNGFKMHLLGTWTRPAQTAVVWHIHDYVSARPLMRRLLRWWRKHCTAVIANSRSVAADLKALLPGVRIVPIYNAVNFERFAPTGRRANLDALSALAPAAQGTIRVGLVATFARWKGHAIFLEALSKLSAETPVRGYVIGGPIYQTGGSQWTMQELKDHSRRLGVAGKVGFTGFLDDTAEAIRSLDIVVHASTQPEPFGMVIVEAMACAKPVIVSKAGGASELFEEERTALGYPPGDATALARQIERLAGNVSLRAGLGEAARTAAEQSFRPDRMACEAIRLYAECHGAKQKAAALMPSLNV